MGVKLTFDVPQPFMMRDGSTRDLTAVSLNNWRVSTKREMVQVWLDAEFTDDASETVSPFFPEPYLIIDVGVSEEIFVNGTAYDLIPGTHWADLTAAGYTDDNVIVILQNIGFLTSGTIS